MHVISVFICSLLACVQGAEGWRGLIPLHSSRTDVERLLGAPADPGGSFYYLGREGVIILYAAGSPCGEHGENEWQVPRDTVVNITVSSEVKPKISNFRIDKKKFKRVDSGHLPYVFYYVDEEEGIRIEVVRGRVDSITYFPAAKDSHLRCPRNSDKAELSGDLTEKEKQLLDKFISRLNQDPQATGLIRMDSERKRFSQFKLTGDTRYREVLDRLVNFWKLQFRLRAEFL